MEITYGGASSHSTKQHSDIPNEMKMLGKDNMVYTVEFGHLADKLFNLMTGEIQSWGEARRLWSKDDDIFEGSQLPDGLEMPNYHEIKAKLYEFLLKLNQKRFEELQKSQARENENLRAELGLKTKAKTGALAPNTIDRLP